MPAREGRPPDLAGRSKDVYLLGDGLCLVKLKPTLDSFTFKRREEFPGTEVIRLDFFELAVARLRSAGINVAFRERVAPDSYISEHHPSPPFETIVKNAAVGSTLLKYPGLFEPGCRFDPPVVKFDFRTDPEDQPIADDYLRHRGYDPKALKDMALATNTAMRAWLAPNDLLDFCLIVAQTPSGSLSIISEFSPDCFRLRAPDGRPLDKDLFRQGCGPEDLIACWSGLVADLREKASCA